MSGPKGGSYRVESAAQREARALRDANAEYARAQSTWESAAVLLSAVSAVCGQELSCARPASVPATADSGAVRRAAAELQAAADAAISRAGEARGRAAALRHQGCIARIAEHFSAPAERPERTTVRPARWQPRNDTVPAEANATIDRVRTEQRVRRRLDELAGLDHDVSRVEALVADIGMAGSPSRVDLIISELDHLIGDARAAADRDRHLRAVRADLSALQARVAEVSGQSAQNLRDRIARLISEQATRVPNELPELVDAAIRETDAEADRSHVVAVMSAALTKLGYSLGPEFRTDLTGARAAAYARSGSSRYGIKVRLEPGSNRFSAQAVKSDAVLTSAREDTAAERAFCVALDTLITLASQDGVALDVDIRTEPGAHKVQQASDALLGTASGTTSGAEHYEEAPRQVGRRK